MTKRIHIIVRGRVQGVSFRWHAQRMARAFGVTGFVRNLGSGEVEIVAEGEEDKLILLKTWAGNGPPSAYVDEIQAEYSDPDQDFHDFSIRY